MSKELVVGVVVAIVASVFAALWPAIGAWYRRQRFSGLLKRELEEIAPRNPEVVAADLVDDPSIPWWRYLAKNFVHEQFLRPEGVATNRDFVLQLDPDVVYAVSQLWKAYDNRDLDQWCYFLTVLSEEKKLKSDDLDAAVVGWQNLRDSRRSAEVAGERGTRGISRGREAGAIPPQVIAARLAAYADLNPLTEWGGGDDREQREHELRAWFYENEHGLLLSADALSAFQQLRGMLLDVGFVDADLIDSFSALRTELKIDLGVRDASERPIPLKSNEL